MTLRDLRPSRPARITAVTATGVLARRLMALGFLPGAQVSIVQVAPFGDPVTVELDGWRISIRLAEAACLDVKEGA